MIIETIGTFRFLQTAHSDRQTFMVVGKVVRLNGRTHNSDVERTYDENRWIDRPQQFCNSADLTKTFVLKCNLETLTFARRNGRAVYTGIVSR